MPKRPNGQAAFVDPRKLLDCLLDPTSPRGRHKARLWASRLGITLTNWQVARDALVDAARYGQARLAETNAFGTKYVIEFQMTGLSEPVWIRSVWLIGIVNRAPVLVTAFPVRQPRVMKDAENGGV